MSSGLNDEESNMADASVEQFSGYADNDYQHGMHTLALISLWLITISGVAAGIYGLVQGLSQ